MKEIKKYTDIIRYGHSSTNGVIQEGDYITITEKIDGANASFRLDNTNPLGVSCYSRNQPLTEESGLSGFYNWVLENIVPIKDKLNPNYIYYGEWLCKHKVVYKDECYKNFYMFSIWDESLELQQYTSDEIVKNEANKLGLKQPQYFYEGKYISFEHIMSFVGKSDMTLVPNTGEGVVVKNVSYFDRFNRQVFVKLVSDKFAEIQKQKLPKNPNVNLKEVELVKSVLTPARVSKIIYKLVDEGLLNEKYCIENMGDILKALGSKVYDDIMKEESELFVEYESDSIKKIVGKNLPNIIKIVLKDEGKM